MTLDEFERLARVIRQPLVLVAATGRILAANPSATALSAAFRAGRRLDEALADGPPAAERLKRWSRHGDPVPVRLTVAGDDGPTVLRAQVARVELADGPAVLINVQPGQHEPFAQLNDRLRALQQEVSYRIAAERERALALRAEEAARLQLERIQRLTAALATALSMTDVVEAIRAHAAPAAGVDAVIVARLEDGILKLSAPEDPLDLRDGTLRLDDPHPLSAAAREQTPQFPGNAGSAADAGGGNALVGALPLVAREHEATLGALGLVARPGRMLEEDERATAVLVALLCGQALERARLYDRERRFAETLQWALLPKQLPELDAVDLAVEYLPAAEWAAVGGDWYDVFSLDGERIGLVVGDVAGHGPAAATTMAQLRNALQAFATMTADPGEALAVLNDYLCAQLPDDMATVVYLVLDRASGTLQYANAGHLPVLLLRGGQTCEFLGAAPGPPVGVTPGQRYETVTERLSDDVCIVGYTDGLIERRDEAIDLGLRRLERAMRATGAVDVRVLCDELVERLVGERRLDDDAVVLVAGTTSASTQDALANTEGESARTPLPERPTISPGQRDRVETPHSISAA